MPIQAWVNLQRCRVAVSSLLQPNTGIGGGDDCGNFRLPPRLPRYYTDILLRIMNGSSVEGFKDFWVRLRFLTLLYFER